MKRARSRSQTRNETAEFKKQRLGQLQEKELRVELRNIIDKYPELKEFQSVVVEPKNNVSLNKFHLSDNALLTSVKNRGSSSVLRQKSRKKTTQPSRNNKQNKNVSSATRCSICLQKEDKLKFFTGETEIAVDEVLALAREILIVGGSESDPKRQAEHLLTDFAVYDEFMHLAPFDAGLIEKNKKLFVSGYIKPIYEDNPIRECGVDTKNIGPINSWWLTGFDGGEKVVFGLSTPYADYYLLAPSTEYAQFMKVLNEKAYLSKLVIEFLKKDSLASYEDLLNNIQASTPPQGLNNFTEDALLRHAQFVVDHVYSYDAAGDEDENQLILTSCMQSLIKLAGVTLGQRRLLRENATGFPVNRNKKSGDTKATTTPLVRQIFENFFVGEIDEIVLVEALRQRCGVCDICQQPDCGLCSACKDMLKFQGSGTQKQACEKKKCPNMMAKCVVELDDEDSDAVNECAEKEWKSLKTKDVKHKVQSGEAKVAWIGDPIGENEKYVFNNCAEINGELIKSGDCVFVLPDDSTIPAYPAKVIYMCEDKLNHRGYFHIHWFYRGNETILGETAFGNEVYLSDECENVLLQSVMCKCQIIYKPPLKDWAMHGGMAVKTDEVIDEKVTYCSKLYKKKRAAFIDIPKSYLKFCPDDKNLSYCPCCVRIDEVRQREMTVLGEKLPRNSDLGKKSSKNFASIRWKEVEYFIGNCIFLSPKAFSFNIPHPKRQCKDTSLKEIDEELYPEFYRKVKTRKNEMSAEVEPFRLAKIEHILSKSQSQSVNADDVTLVVKKFYRPENTHLGSDATYTSDFNMVYCSEDVVTVKLSMVRGKCNVKFTNYNETDLELWLKEPENFYFTASYNPSTHTFAELPRLAQKEKEISKNSKSNDISTQHNGASSLLTRPLRAMDVFAGCGGLSEGLHQAGFCETLWAIEKEEPAANAFKLNNPDCIVLNDDCNELLKRIMSGDQRNKVGRLLPQKGDVEVLCGGPPCQGFSGMNRFTSGQYSKFKNSLITTYLSYCDYYRPRFFLLENVRAFVSYKKTLILKLTLHCLIRMGYQCTFGILQAGNFGVPQTRRRAFIFAAAPGEKLPSFPEIRHTFSLSVDTTMTIIDSVKCETGARWKKSAPFRQVTVRDSLSDLPPVKNGASVEKLPYNPEYRSHYQKILQGPDCPLVVSDHICKDMAPLVVARIKLIPHEPNADWRDLPNKVVELSDGTFTKKLQYTYHDKKNGYAHGRRLRGVCACAKKEKKPTESCDSSTRQHNTIIPWCLPHTGNRHNHWSGLYGRLNYNRFFMTTITNPEPMGKQGQVLHPEQDRVISVRECARSQGFPDSYRFYGNILDRYKQIGNAVPPPLAAAIGLEFKKCLIEKRLRHSGTNLN